MVLICLAMLRRVIPHLQLGAEADAHIIVFMWLLLLFSIWVRELMQNGMLKTNKTNFGKFDIQATFSFSTIPKCLF